MSNQKDTGNVAEFEGSLDALENIVVQLEKGDMKLEDALKAFEKGVGLTRVCRQILDQAEQKIEKLSSSSEGDRVESFTEE